MRPHKETECKETEPQSKSWSCRGKRWRSAARGGSTLRSRSDLLRHIDRDHHVHHRTPAIAVNIFESDSNPIVKGRKEEGDSFY